MNANNYKVQILNDRKSKDEFLKSSPGSPIDKNDIADFTNLDYFEVDIKYRFELDLQEFPEKEKTIIKDSKGNDRIFLKWGHFEFDVDGKNTQVTAFKSNENDPNLFISFKDLTTAEESYGAGRYLDLHEENDKTPFGKWILDFNLVYNPWCAYNFNYSCPLVPVENIVNVAIKAGEKKYNK